MLSAWRPRIDAIDLPAIMQRQIPDPRSPLLSAPGRKTLGDSISRRLWLLQSETLCSEARRRTRLQDFGDPPLDPALGVLVNSLEFEADLHPLGRFIMRAHLRDLLETRLRLTQAWSQRSKDLDSMVIDRPIFITGMPRSGSTFLHELLAEDPQNRAPLVWEVMFPLAPQKIRPNGADPRIGKAEACLWWFRRLAPGADLVYPMRARTPHECVAIHSYTLMSEEFVSTARVPTYEAFLHAADLGPIYRWQKRFLQHLQLGCPDRRWVLKSPDHVYGLETILTVFPDATIIQTHRDPIDVLQSQIQLTQVLEAMYARPIPRDQLGLSEARKVKQLSDCITRFRDAYQGAASRIIDVTYREFVSDPMSVVQRIYEQLNIPLTQAAAERMRHLATARSRYRKPPQSPTLAHFGLDRAAERERFQAYCTRFRVCS
jgi:Sulfotransferase family